MQYSLKESKLMLIKMAEIDSGLVWPVFTGFWSLAGPGRTFSFYIETAKIASFAPGRAQAWKLGPMQTSNLPLNST